MTEYIQKDISEYEDRPSKSQIKRELAAITELGKRLVELPESKVRQLPVSEQTVEHILLAQKITSREGRRRQTHYVGKVLRQENTEAIQQLLDSWQNGDKEQIALMHRIENLRDRLLQDDKELTFVVEQYPHADVQYLRTLIRAARKENNEQTKKNYRALFQALKTLLSP